MFLNNKYTQWYNSIINNALKEKRAKSKDHYYELHHIIPKSLNGSNDNINLVYLTAKEHFICHALLVKMTTGKAQMKMLYSLHMFRQDRYGNFATSRIYEKYKGLHHLSDETKSKISLKLKGKKKSLEHKQKMSQSRKGKKIAPHTEDTKIKISNANFGKRRTDSEKIKMSLSQRGIKKVSEKRKQELSLLWKLYPIAKGRRWFNNGEVSVMQFDCPEGFVPGRIYKRK